MGCRGWTSAVLVLGMVGFGTGVSAVANPQDEIRAKASWWDRTAKSIVPAGTHRVRSDADPRQASAIAAQVDALWSAVAQALGPLRIRALAPRDLLVFATREDLDDTMRSQLAIDATGPVFAFRSPLGIGIALSEENAPAPMLERGLAAAVVAEYLRSTCGADLPPAIEIGLADLVSRGSVGGNRGSGGIGDAGLCRVRTAASGTSARTPRELLEIDASAWRTKAAADRAGVLQEQASSLVRFLAGQPRSAEAAAFLRYLHGVSAGMTHDTSFASAFGVVSDEDWAVLGRRWREHLMAERANPDETTRERLAFLGEGLRALDGEGVVAASFAQLARDLGDRSFAGPSPWRPGFSVVEARCASVFTPTLPCDTESESNRKGKSGGAATASFTLVPGVKASQGASGTPPEITTTGVRQRLRLSWHRTRADPEAPWVWSIETMD